MKKYALKAAFPYTLPVFTGYLFLGLAYGIYMNKLGFSFLFPMFMSLFIYAGSMQFLCGNILLSMFNPIYTFFLTLMVNARHLFYGISMLDKYKNMGFRKLYLIFGLTDETFSVNAGIEIPKGIDKGWFLFFVTLLNQSYWVIASTIGGLLGELIAFNVEGIEFVMTALFVVIFVDQWINTKEHRPAIIGLLTSLLCLIIFGADQFIIPSMIAILLLLSLFKNKLEKEETV